MPYVQMDITDKAAVEKAIKEANVDAVVHCAAWTAVDAAEDEENQPKGPSGKCYRNSEYC